MNDYIVPIEMQNLNANALGIAVYAPFNAAGLEGSLSFIRVTNDSNTDVYLSYDNIHDHEFIPAGKTIQVCFQANSILASQVSLLRKHTVVYLRGNAGVGYIYLSGYYNE